MQAEHRHSCTSYKCDTGAQTIHIVEKIQSIRDAQNPEHRQWQEQYKLRCHVRGADPCHKHGDGQHLADQLYLRIKGPHVVPKSQQEDQPAADDEAIDVCKTAQLTKTGHEQDEASSERNNDTNATVEGGGVLMPAISLRIAEPSAAMGEIDDNLSR